MTETAAQLAGKKVAELQAIANGLGIDASKLRKGELIDTIVTAQGGTSALTANGSGESSDAPTGNRNRGRRSQSVAATEHVNVTAGSGLDATSTDSNEDANESESRPGSRRNRNRRGQGSQQNGSRATESNEDGESTNGRSDNQDATSDAAYESGDGSGRNRNGRNRNRNRRGGEDYEPEILDDDVLIPIAGILDVLDNYAFVRTSGYLPGPSDVYVSLGQVKKYNLRRGDAVIGAVKQPREGENTRQKYNALVTVERINGQSVDQAQSREDFNALTAVYPTTRLRFESTSEHYAARAIDLLAPTGFGQRTLLVAPPASGATSVLHQLADGVSLNAPEAHLMVVVVDERPEEVTALTRSIKGEVVSSTFDRAAEEHTMIAELAIERAKRMVELGLDVVVLLDSVTALGRAYQATAPLAHRAVGNVVDAAALVPLKRLMGAARKIENGGSLTIVAVVDVETGAAIDQAILDEFAGTANSQIRLVSDRIDGEVTMDVRSTFTREAEVFLAKDESVILSKLRRTLAEQGESGYQQVLRGLKNSNTNVEFLLSSSRSS